jgi:hypothetical protein
VLATPGAFQTRLAGGDNDAFVTKLNAAGTALVYSTYLGGNGKDSAAAISVDSAGNAYVTGFTTSTDFPTSPGAFQRANRDALRGQAFVTKLNASGTALVYSTLLGGSSGAGASGIAVDSSGYAYVTGATSSTDFPTTPGAFQRGGQSHVFVTKLDRDGSSLVYSTFIGGGGPDGAAGISVDSLGSAYVVGFTASNSFPTANALQRTNASGLAFKSYSGGAAWDVANNRLTADGVSALVVDPMVTSTIYAATNRGLFKSTDSGTSWLPSNEGLTALDLRALAIDPRNTSILYAVPSSDPGLFRSTDSGDSWRETSLTTGVFCVAVDPVTSSIIYAGANGSEGAGVYKSIDGGNTWTLANISAGFNARSFVKLLAIDPKNPSTIYAGVTQGQFEIELYNPDGIVKSTDGGRTWGTTGLKGITLESMSIDPENPSTIYVAAGDDGVRKSTDGGDTWNQSNQGLGSGAAASLIVDPAVPSIVYAGTPSGVFKSTNNGVSWSSTALTDVLINSLAIHPRDPTRLYAGAALRRDAFVTKLNPGGSALVYSSYLGGRRDDDGFAIAVDPSGSACVTGLTNSIDFPTASPIASPRSNYHSVFVARIMPSQLTATPVVISAVVRGKELLVFGENFNDGALTVVNDNTQKTSNDPAAPTSMLIAKKAGKRIGPGQTAIIQVKNSDGTLSEPFTFVRPE